MRDVVERSSTPGPRTGLRRVVPVAVMVSVALFACNQDSASSNEDRETHMGNILAAAPASTQSAPAPAPVAAPAAPATGSATASPAAPSMPSKKEKP